MENKKKYLFQYDEKKNWFKLHTINIAFSQFIVYHCYVYHLDRGFYIFIYFLN